MDHLFIQCPFLIKLVWQVICFNFNIPPPTNINNLFGQWLNGIEKKIKEQIRVGVYALIWAIWNCHDNVIFNNVGHDQFFAGYKQGYILDSHLVLSSTRGPAGTYRYWMHSVDGGHLGYLQPGWLATY
jgi:hypothetical protein